MSHNTPVEAAASPASQPAEAASAGTDWVLVFGSPVDLVLHVVAIIADRALGGDELAQVCLDEMSMAADRYLVATVHTYGTKA